MTMAKKTNNPLHAGISSFLQTAKLGPFKKGTKHGKAIVGQVFILGVEDRNLLHALLEEHGPQWQLPTLMDQSQRESMHFAGVNGPIWIFCQKRRQGPLSHQGRLEDSVYSWHRDHVGAVLNYTKAYQIKDLQLHLHHTTAEQEVGILVGLELAGYSYKSVVEGREFEDCPQLSISKDDALVDKNILTEARAIGLAVNTARHLVNTPPNLLNPETMATFVKKILQNSSLEVEVWNQSRLAKEGMGLHLGVGQGSSTPPCMVHISYRPKKSTAAKTPRKPVAFVGKGVTFDSGGLDIKPSSNMRLMKKDMGGAAALVGLAQWLAKSSCSLPVDIYLGLAENSVDAASMRPGDVLQARNGMSVEIHNTDAEGRLVLADVMDVAVNRKGADEPQAVIDVATLTGAIKAGLGAEIAGLFCNDDQLAEHLNHAGFMMGEPNWRMPLYSRYTRGMETPFADIVNCVDGFGGAITAALFLEKFCKGKPWAHLDIYAWNDKPMGPLQMPGGNGQTVQTLIEFVKMKSSPKS